MYAPRGVEVCVGMKQVEVMVIMQSALELATRICGAIISAILLLLLL